jgi:four helix bundle protein
MRIKSFEELEVWQKAHELTLLVYTLTQKFPREERFGLVSQWRRAASAIAANIAEGFGRRSTKEFLHSLRISNGETEETRYFAKLSRDLGYITLEGQRQVYDLCDSESRLLSALGRSLQEASARVTSYQSPVTRRNRRTA